MVSISLDGKPGWAPHSEPVEMEPLFCITAYVVVVGQVPSMKQELNITVAQ